MIVATAGHIDHGKTALVRALTGVDTDRLPEEKARGISIDLGFAHCTIDGRTIGFVDVPGHERFIRNMLSGVYGVGHVLLVIAADDGVMPQTREHFDIVNLLGVEQGTIVITKKDRVNESQLAQVEREARDLLSATAFADMPVIAVSSITGEGIDALRGRLAAVAAEERAREASGALARYVVDRVFTAAGSGTIVTGTVIAGEIGLGDMLVITPVGKKARVRKLQRHGTTVERGYAGERCAINLANVERADVTRGDWLVADEAHHPTDRIDVRVKVLASVSRPLKHWTPVHVHIGAADIPARVALRRGEAVPPGEQALVQLRLQRPIHAAHGDRFILRDQSGRHTLAGGVVIDPFAPPRRNAQRPAVLAAFEKRDAGESLAVLLSASAEGVNLEWLARVFNLPIGKMLGMVPANALVVQTSSHVAFSGERAAQLRELVTARIQRFHADNSGATGMELAKLHKDVARTLPLELFVALVKLIAPRGGLNVQGSQLRLASHDPAEDPRDAKAWQQIRPLLENAAPAIPSVQDLSSLAGLPSQQLRDVMHRKSKAGELFKITPERFALRETMEMLRLKAEETAKRQPNGLFTAAQYRDVIGVGRGLAIEILEWLDKRGVTKRQGDVRLIRPRS